MRLLLTVFCTLLLAVGCAQENATEQDAASSEAPAGPSLGLRPQGDTEISPDLSQVSDELKQVFD